MKKCLLFRWFWLKVCSTNKTENGTLLKDDFGRVRVQGGCHALAPSL
jgi:hypothetical protein